MWEAWILIDEGGFGRRFNFFARALVVVEGLPNTKIETCVGCVAYSAPVADDGKGVARLACLRGINFSGKVPEMGWSQMATTREAEKEGGNMEGR